MMMPILFNGSPHPLLAEETAYILKTTLGKRDIHFFPDDEIFVEIHEPVLGKDVFVIQALTGNLNVYLMELFILLDALKRAGARLITVVLPYYGYSRQDRLDKPGVSITAKLIADLLTQAGAQRLITMDLHSEQIEGFFNIPVEHVHSRELMISFCKKLSLDLKNAIVVAPDKGGIKIASAYAQDLDLPLALIDKERIDPFHVEMRMFLGDVQEKTVLLTDDMCATGGTLVHAAEVCKELGAKKIIGFIGHGLFLDGALDKIVKSPIEFLLVTNSVPIPEELANHPKLKIVSVAPLLAEAIQKNIQSD